MCPSKLSNFCLTLFLLLLKTSELIQAIQMICFKCRSLYGAILGSFIWMVGMAIMSVEIYRYRLYFGRNFFYWVFCNDGKCEARLVPCCTSGFEGPSEFPWLFTRLWLLLANDFYFIFLVMLLVLFFSTIISRMTWPFEPLIDYGGLTIIIYLAIFSIMARFRTQLTNYIIPL